MFLPDINSQVCDNFIGSFLEHANMKADSIWEINTSETQTQQFKSSSYCPETALVPAVRVKPLNFNHPMWMEKF